MNTMQSKKVEPTILTPFEYLKEHIVLMEAFPMTPSPNV